jgi:hypothetical protein
MPMAEDTSVFVRGAGTLDRLVECIGEMIGRPLKRVAEASWPVYNAVLPGVDVRVFDQEGLDDDQGIAFSTFDYVIDVEDLSGGVEERFFHRGIPAATSRARARECGNSEATSQSLTLPPASAVASNRPSGETLNGGTASRAVRVGTR